MSYDYQRVRVCLFTDEGQRVPGIVGNRWLKFLKTRDHVHKALKISGAIRMQEAMEATSGDSWEQMAYVDRMVELGELREITTAGAAQFRIFVGGSKLTR